MKMGPQGEEVRNDRVDRVEDIARAERAEPQHSEPLGAPREQCAGRVEHEEAQALC